MSEIMPIQIVRNMLPGERVPAFSTIDLLMGHAYLDPVVPKKEIEPEPIERDAAEAPIRKRGCGLTKNHYESRRRFYAEERAKLIPIIREKLLQKKTRISIAKEIGKSDVFLLNVIRGDSELTELASQLPNVGAQIMAQRSADKFKPHEADIHRWLIEGRTYQFMAERIGVNKSTIYFYISKRPHLRALCQRRRK